MCEYAIQDESEFIDFVPDYFITEDMLSNISLIARWDFMENFKKRKNLKKEIARELLVIAWHPDRWWDWCVPEDEKKTIEKLWC